mmetsp:Transcript_65025/g.172143  ORF Transcript_65025/g.172143 Transcript_65025/m.172143 type:complete len:256 (+) Transcript_65025:4298-5065(+)
MNTAVQRRHPIGILHVHLCAVRYQDLDHGFTFWKQASEMKGSIAVHTRRTEHARHLGCRACSDAHHLQQSPQQQCAASFNSFQQRLLFKVFQACSMLQEGLATLVKTLGNGQVECRDTVPRGARVALAAAAQQPHEFGLSPQHGHVQSGAKTDSVRLIRHVHREHQLSVPRSAQKCQFGSLHLLCQRLLRLLILERTRELLVRQSQLAVEAATHSRVPLALDLSKATLQLALLHASPHVLCVASLQRHVIHVLQV